MEAAMAFEHISVLYNEVLDGLHLHEGGIWVDSTVGGGGHSKGILTACGKNAKLIAVDQDANALAAAKERLSEWDGQVVFVHDNFVHLPQIIKHYAPDGVDGILLDIGVSSPQIDQPERGFSYMHDAPLDMRMNPDVALDARTVVNTYSEDALEYILREYGEEKWARRIAKIICERRALLPIETTFQLVDCVERAIPKAKREAHSHVAKRTFQAVRIEVNGELKVLEDVIDAASDCLKPGGRMAIISFHSLEDRIVKNHFRYLASDCVCPPEAPVCTCDKVATVKLITRKPVTAGKEECEANPRAASAKLRIIEKIEPKPKKNHPTTWMSLT